MFCLKSLKKNGICRWNLFEFGNRVAFLWQRCFFFNLFKLFCSDGSTSVWLVSMKTRIRKKNQKLFSYKDHNCFLFLHVQGYYKRTPEYEPMLRRHWEGCFEVANVHTAYLINLRHADSTKLAFFPPPPGWPQFCFRYPFS